MTEEQALIATILAHPADDLPRLVYADFIEEGGDAARAEFIRVQCELARLGTPPREFAVPRAAWSFFRAEASAIVTLNAGDRPIVVGERIDVVLPKQSGLRSRFEGMLVTDARRDRVAGGAVDTSVELKMDGESGPWAGAELRTRERELWIGGVVITTILNEVRPWLPNDIIVHLAIDRPTAYTPRQPEAYVSRGFIESIRLPLAAFLGGECGRCGGEGTEGHAYDRGMRSDCPICSGTGRTEGIAKRLFETMPVTRVEFTDREPRQQPPGQWYWSWGGSDERDAWPSTLPRELMHMPSITSQRTAAISYDTREKAISALFDIAAPAYGRSLAHLDALAAV